MSPPWPGGQSESRGRPPNGGAGAATSPGGKPEARGGAEREPGTEPRGHGSREADPVARERVRLTRSREHKKLAGVCGGLGRYYDVDPVMFRVPLVVLSVTGGFGLVFYGFAWLTIPTVGERGSELRKLISGRVDAATLTAVFFALSGCGLLVASLGNRGLVFSVLLAGAVAGAAHWSLRRRTEAAAQAEGAPSRPASAGHPAADAPPETQAPPAPTQAAWWQSPLTGSGGRETGYLWGPEDMATVPPAHGAAPGAPPRYGSHSPVRERAGASGAGNGEQRPGGQPFGGLVQLLAMLAAVGGLAVTWGSHTVGPSLVISLSCALAVYGLALAVSAFVGRVGVGTVVMAVFTALGLAGAAAIPRDITSDWRVTTWSPSAAEEVRPHYALGTGTGELDMSELSLAKDETVHTGVRIGAGELRVTLPRDAEVRLSGKVGAGALRAPVRIDSSDHVVRDESVGMNTRRKLTLEPLEESGENAVKETKGTVVLDLDVGVGEVDVVRELADGRPSDRTPARPAEQSGRLR